MSSDTPLDPLPIVRHLPGDHDPAKVDSVWMFEMRRELLAEVRAGRREVGEALNEVRTRLSAIEANLAAGAATMEKHDDQLRELIDLGAELERRVGAQEAHRVGDIDSRVRSLEQAEAARKQEEFAREYAARRSFAAKLGANALSGAATAGGGLAVTGFIGFMAWLFVQWVKAGAPGAGGTPR